VGDRTIEIKIHDKKGLCSIGIKEEESDCGNIYQKTLIASVWKDFRSERDSCSNEVCNCSAMNIPVWSSEENAKQTIANEFIHTLEWLTDTPISIPWKKKSWRRGFWQGRLLAAKNYDNIVKTNRVYLDRFLDIYGENLENADNLRHTMDARFEKAEIIYNDAIFRAELESKTRDTDYKLIAIWVAVAGLALRLIIDILW